MKLLTCLLKYAFASLTTLGANIKVAVMVGIAISANTPSIKLIIKAKEVVAPKRILKI